MKRFIITEEEKDRIRGLYEENINNLPQLGPERLSSKLAAITKKEHEFFNKKYPGTNMPIDGNWLDKKYNEALAKYITEKGGTPEYCKANDDYCGEGREGTVYTRDKNILNLLRQESESKINTTNDKAYDYKLENGKYYFKGKENTQYAKSYPNWVEATGKGLESIKAKVKFI